MKGEGWGVKGEGLFTDQQSASNGWVSVYVYFTDYLTGSPISNIWWPMPLFLIFISEIDIDTSTIHLLYTIMLMGVCFWWCGREEVWRLAC